VYLEIELVQSYKIGIGESIIPACNFHPDTRHDCIEKRIFVVSFFIELFLSSFSSYVQHLPESMPHHIKPETTFTIAMLKIIGYVPI